MNEKNEPSTFRVVDRRGQPKEEPRKVEPTFTPKPPEEKKPQPKPSKPRNESGIDFANFIISLSTSALMHMGAVEEAEAQGVPKNLGLAKQEVDMIEMLEEKTRGNLDEQEVKLMEQVLYELRLRFVEASK